MKIAITGGTGKLGTELVAELTSVGHECVLMDNLIIPADADWVINCIAHTDVDSCGADSFRANVAIPGALAINSHQLGIPFIHFSSDFVFAGKEEVYTEECLAKPTNKYGIQKMQSEQLVRMVPKHYIFRLQWLYGRHRRDFVDYIKEQSEVTVDIRRVGAPTWARDVAIAVRLVISKPSKYGTYHMSAEGAANQKDYALAIKDVVVVEGRHPGVPRPTRVILDNNKLKRVFGVELPHWRESLERFLE